MLQTEKTLIFALLVTVMFSVVASVARADMLPDGTPEEQYNYAIALTIEDGAEEAFKEFIVANPYTQKPLMLDIGLAELSLWQKILLAQKIH